MKRTPLKRKTPMPRTSAKTRERLRSVEGKAARAYLAAVKRLPCVICGKPGPSDAHHVQHDRYGARKPTDFDVIPLCKWHHQDSPEAFHTNKRAWREKHGPDHGFLPQVRAQVAAMEAANV